MAEPLLDLSEIIDLYKEDAKRMIEQMKGDLRRWPEVQQGGPARTELRRISHQLRGSGRTYGFHRVTRISKALENIVLKLEKARLKAEDRVQASIQRKIDCLETIFREA